MDSPKDLEGSAVYYLGMISDFELLSRIVKGEGRNEALGELMCRYDRLVRSIGRTWFPDENVLDDFTQETFKRVVVSAPRFQPQEDASVRAWIAKIARNLAVDWIRRGRSEGGAKSRLIDCAVQARNPVDLLIEADHVWFVLNAMDQDLREVLVLREMYGLTYSELVAVIGVPYGTICGRLHRARIDFEKRLRELDEKGGTES